ncbi:unnamed protein product [Ixodes hexagonus]
MMLLRKAEPDLCRDLYGSVCRVILDKVKASRDLPFWSPTRAAFLDRMDTLGTFLSSTVARKHPVSGLLATVYESCLVEREVHTPTTLLRELLSDLGLASWPLVEADVAQTIQVVDASLRIYGLPSLVSLWVNEPELLLPRAQHLRPQQFPRASYTYRSYMLDFVEPLIFNTTASKAQLTESLVSFEARLARVLPLPGQGYDTICTSEPKDLAINLQANDTVSV